MAKIKEETDMEKILQGVDVLRTQLSAAIHLAVVLGSDLMVLLMIFNTLRRSLMPRSPAFQFRQRRAMLAGS